MFPLHCSGSDRQLGKWVVSHLESHLVTKASRVFTKASPLIRFAVSCIASGGT